MVTAETVQLTPDEINAILKQSNGPYVLLEMVRIGRIDAEIAVSAIDNARRPAFLKRLLDAILNTISSR